jgi:hypothetical protein
MKLWQVVARTGSEIQPGEWRSKPMPVGEAAALAEMMVDASEECYANVTIEFYVETVPIEDIDGHERCPRGWSYAG